MNTLWKLDDVDESASTGLIALLTSPTDLSVHSPASLPNSQPHGRHHIRVCRGLACHVKGSAAVLETLQRSLGILSGETTPDGNFSLEIVDCLDACGMAPVIAVNEQLYPGITPPQVQHLIVALKDE
jgi:NADH:ubiquinone oxidoreductase subunit E